MQFKAVFLTLLPLILAIPVPPTSQLIDDAKNGIVGTGTNIGDAHVPGKDAAKTLTGSVLPGKVAGVNLADPTKRSPPTDGAGNLGVNTPNGANVFNGDLAGHNDGTTEGSGDFGLGQATNGADIVTGSAEGSTVGSDALGANRRDKVGDAVTTVKETTTQDTTGTNLDPNALSATAGSTNANVDGTTDGSPIVDANAAGQNVGASVDGVNGGKPSVTLTGAGQTFHVPRDNSVNAPVGVEVEVGGSK